MNSLKEEIDNLTVKEQSDLHNILENHLIAIGILEPDILTEDQRTILEDRIEKLKKEQSKAMTWEEVKTSLKEKFPQLNLDGSSHNPLRQKLIGAVLKLSIQGKLELFRQLRQAADISFQYMLQEMDMTEDQWTRMHEEMYVHFSAEYKKEADEIRRRKGLVVKA